MYMSRMSQMPVEPQDMEAYQEDRRALYDGIAEELGEPHKILTDEEMQEWQSRLDAGCEKLAEDYTFRKKMTLPKTQKEFKKLLDTYGPIALTYDDNKRLEMVIIDERI